MSETKVVKSYVRPKNRKKKVTEDGVVTPPHSYLPPARPVCSNPIDRFCEVILKWKLDADDSDTSYLLDLPTVPLNFGSYSKYVQAWEPLLTRETQANLMSSLSRKPNVGKCQMCPSDALDDARSLLIKLECSLEGYDKAGSMQMLLFSPTTGSELQAMAGKKKFPESTKYILGMVIAHQRHMYMVMVLRETYVDFVSRIPVTGSSKSSSQSRSMTMTYMEVGGVTSQFREFLALHEAYRMRILRVLLQPAMLMCRAGSSTPPQSPPSSVSPSVALGDIDTGEEDGSRGSRLTKWNMAGVGWAFNSYLHSKFNDSQRGAIQSAVETNTGFCLIQGPPGTGKTSTILGLLNSLHIRDYNKYFETLLSHALGPEGLRCRERPADPVPWLALVNSLVSTSARPHLLVVAPSNVAVDNIIQRIAEKGFKDSNGSTYFPHILRVGSGGTRHADSDARAVSLEEAVEEMLRETEDSCTAIDKEIGSAVRATVQSILQLQTVLLNIKICWEAHPLGPGWELRITLESGHPYWVDHNNKITSMTPPPVLPNTKSDFTLESLPEYKFYTHSLVQKLEELRILHLRKVRVRVVREYYEKLSRNRSGASIRHTLESSFIDEADIIFTTLNSSGHPCLEGSVFPVVIIDEAGQCVEPSTLIPLRLGCVQCVMVGDQKQLSATIFSKELASKKFDRSLFERINEARLSTQSVGSVMLDTQYRMLPAISRFPSLKFYNGLLKDGENVRAPGYGPVFLGAPQKRNFCENSTDHYPLKPFIFFDLLSSKDALSSEAQSRSNAEEARLCLQLVELLISEAARSKESVGSIGIITPYQEQLRDLTRMFRNASLLKHSGQESVPSSVPTVDAHEDDSTAPADGYVGNADELYAGLYGTSATVNPLCDIELNTVDAFQGREKDIVVISCVRSNDIGSIGFLSDTRRMNVAITRARFGLYIIGNAATLRNNDDWGDLIEYAEQNDSLVSIRSADVDVYEALVNAHRDGEASGSGNSMVYRHKRALPDTDNEPAVLTKISRSDSIEDGEIE